MLKLLQMAGAGSGLLTLFPVVVVPTRTATARAVATGNLVDEQAGEARLWDLARRELALHCTLPPTALQRDLPGRRGALSQ
jgi:hypothetical protein